MALEATPGFEQNLTYSAEVFRRGAYGFQLQRGSTVGSVVGGIVGAGDFTTTYGGSGLGVTTSTGEAIVPGSSSTSQSGYYCRGTSSTANTPSSANPSNPRVDLVYLQVVDETYVGGSTNAPSLSIATGTPTSGASLSNLSGAPALPTSSLALAYVLIPAAASTISNTDIANVAQMVTPATLFGVLTPQATASLTAVSGQYINIGGSLTVTLPVAGIGPRVRISNPLGYAVTVQHNSSENIYGPGMPGVSSFLLSGAGSFVELVCDTNWNVVAGGPDSGWKAFSYSNSWGSAGGPGGAAGYRLQGNVVRLAGTISGGTSSNAFATLPSGYRPTYAVNLSGVTSSGTVGCLFQVSTGGVIVPNFASGSVPTLDGLTFTVD